MQNRLKKKVLKLSFNLEFCEATHLNLFLYESRCFVLSVNANALRRCIFQTASLFGRINKDAVTWCHHPNIVVITFSVL